MAKPVQTAEGFRLTLAELIAAGAIVGNVNLDNRVRRAIGRNTTVSTSLEDVSDNGSGAANLPTASTAMEIVSSSAADLDTSGAGLRKARVVGLNAAGTAIQTEVVNMNGITAVALASNYRAIIDVFADDVGPTLVASGTVDVQGTGGGTKYATMAVGAVRSFNGLIAVPVGSTALVLGFDVFAYNSASEPVEAHLMATVSPANLQEAADGQTLFFAHGSQFAAGGYGAPRKLDAPLRLSAVDNPVFAKVQAKRLGSSDVDVTSTLTYLLTDSLPFYGFLG